MSRKKHISVFISYSHDSKEHKSIVLALAQQLRSDGIETVADQFVNGSPPEGWPLWMERQIEQADYVLMIFTPKYLRRFNGKEVVGRGLGATWEGAVIGRQEIYEAGAINVKFIPALFDEQANKLIPKVLRRTTYYHIPEDYTALLRYLTNQPLVLPLPVGNIKALPPDSNSLANAHAASDIPLPTVSNAQSITQSIKTGQKFSRSAKTALFRRQLKLIDDIESFFKLKLTSTFDDKFSFHQIIAINGAYLLADYARINFGVQVKSKLLDIHCPAYHFHPDTPVIPLDSPTMDNEETSESEELTWDKYFYYVIRLPKEYIEAVEYVAMLSSSSILSTILKRPLAKFLETLASNTEMVRTTLNECALEMPRAYPTVDSLKKFHSHWLWNRFNKKREDLMHPAQTILDEVRKYLEPDYID
ncbi:MAG: TIR domain-containing protein [Deltaproteobacteria bacterium]|nr:TIR domain-containing protein [Deltaproteobacteria bacterium]